MPRRVSSRVSTLIENQKSRELDEQKVEQQRLEEAHARKQRQQEQVRLREEERDLAANVSDLRFLTLLVDPLNSPYVLPFVDFIFFSVCV
jgi:hypothetical protein